ncbi:CCHC-type Zinc finger, nucleic acid binding protein a [Plakobranchus ocellatus]|uniref:CCHC-type Zinc finger, nucleic acid binding protein a n=1 Tax=Plakobranchus ocellatus TaxID=259542 RepID=A0AAV4BBM2_9GAST|nr:CCHC-type Zinc finger, nucleic acid binding protein a [Plakobranchus ocellatus]
MASSNPCATGYGPSANRTFRILFDGDERKFSLWETKFLGFMRVRNLHSVFKDLSNQDTPVDANKNEEAYAELVQVLDDRSVSLIIRDARDDGQKALQILRNHYRPTGKPRVITLYTELTSLIKLNHESITDYIIRAETSAASLRDAGEKVSDSLLISMVLKGLPTDYQPFVTVITQKEEELTFQEFKVAFRNHEDTEEISRQHMNSSSKPSSSAIMSYKHKRWCQNCKSSTHDTNFCRKTQPPRQITQTPTTRKCNSRGLGKRIKTRPKYLDDYVVTNDNVETESDENDFLNSTFLHYCYNTVHQIPTCYKNAISCDDATKWHKAMIDEMSALEENGTFECTTLPPGRNAVGGRWVFNVKTNAKGEETFKARYVAKGFSQISWRSKKQQSVALSSCEAEYMAMSSATQEGKFLLSLVNDVSCIQDVRHQCTSCHAVLRQSFKTFIKNFEA